MDRLVILKEKLEVEVEVEVDDFSECCICMEYIKLVYNFKCDHGYCNECLTK
jgi:hypothetical protein